MTLIWTAPLALGAIWPLLFAFRWHRPLLALLDAGALLAAVAIFAVIQIGGDRFSRRVVHPLFLVVNTCIATVALLTGGLASPKAFWLLLVPLAAVLWTGRRSGVAWTALTVAVLALLLGLEPHVRGSAYAMQAEFYGLGRWLSMASLLTVVVALLAVNEASRTRSWNSLVAKQADLTADIEARRKAESDLRLAEARYRSLVECMPGITYSVPADGTLENAYVSPQVETVLGYTIPEWLSAADFWMERLHPEDRDRVIAEYERCLREMVPFRCEYRYLARDGHVVWVHDDSVLVRDAAGRPLFLQGTMVDINEHKRLEERLAHAQRMEIVGRLAGGVAHDFNNLLTAIVGHVGFALEELSSGGIEGVRDDVEQVLRAAERAKNLTGQLLAYSRRQVIEPKVTSLNGLVLDMDKMLRRLIGEHIELVTTPMPGLGFVRVDRGQIEQVLANLAVNARDAMPTGGTLTIETSNITLSADDAEQYPDAQPGDYVTMAVSDTGCGMSDDVMAHLFEPFYTTKEVGQGTGLGLATVYGIVRQHGGVVYAYSEPGHGSVFKIYLPRVSDGPDREAGAAAPLATLSGRETVLVAEDEPAVRGVTTRMLRQLGYQVLEAGNGEEAVRLARGHTGPIDLLLTDIVMPRMGGNELAEALSLTRPQLRIIYVSGYTETGVGHYGLFETDTAFLQKPFTATTLANRVRETLDAVATPA